ncbi:putative membrane protein YeaQ/YmgE (transglycosylase-associated protein family) [Conyzicola lurida]|uniref:Putative membrane protein YeaQ/YmgE (Transglycosylase-associated protein family) n=1 Tax=Conyzicola lurida TaxID=1172621 RepID=A0A841AQ22_9MICO|nr:putative membrane protein YeaQ/YmgE (transglycosylase-associated protein family) [Conyzicola lurida]
MQLIAVAAASALFGGATSFAQTFLPDVLRPFANSASGWTLLTAMVVAECRARTVPSAVFGAVSFVALVLGYQIVSGLRGSADEQTLFLIIGIVVGPFVGVAASWFHRDGWRALLGSGILSGIAVGEGVYGLVLISDTTGWFYWTIIAVIGLVLLILTARYRIHNARGRVLLALVVLAVGVAFFFAYLAAGQISR